MAYSTHDLTEAKRQIDSTLHKLRAVVTTLENRETASCKAQITLAKRRIAAFEIAVALIERELSQTPCS